VSIHVIEKVVLPIAEQVTGRGLHGDQELKRFLALRLIRHFALQRQARGLSCPALEGCLRALPAGELTALVQQLLREYEGALTAA
jgi:hypothetical protein